MRGHAISHCLVHAQPFQGLMLGHVNDLGSLPHGQVGGLMANLHQLAEDRQAVANQQVLPDEQVTERRIRAPSA